VQAHQTQAIEMSLYQLLHANLKELLSDQQLALVQPFLKQAEDTLLSTGDLALAEMEIVEFLQCLKQCWKTHGWGTFDIDLSYYQQGFLVGKIWNSPFAQQAPQGNRPVCFLEAGILSAFFSRLTGRELHCLQTTCESLGADCNRFILGLPERLNPVEAWLEEEQDHETILDRLCSSKPFV